MLRESYQNLKPSNRLQHPRYGDFSSGLQQPLGKKKFMSKPSAVQSILLAHDNHFISKQEYKDIEKYVRAKHQKDMYAEMYKNAEQSNRMGYKPARAKFQEDKGGRSSNLARQAQIGLDTTVFSNFNTPHTSRSQEMRNLSPPQTQQQLSNHQANLYRNASMSMGKKSMYRSPQIPQSNRHDALDNMMTPFDQKCLVMPKRIQWEESAYHRSSNPTYLTSKLML